MKRQVSKCRMILLVNSLEVFLCVLTVGEKNAVIEDPKLQAGK